MIDKLRPMTSISVFTVHSVRFYCFVICVLGLAYAGRFRQEVPVAEAIGAGSLWADRYGAVELRLEYWSNYRLRLKTGNVDGQKRPIYRYEWGTMTYSDHTFKLICRQVFTSTSPVERLVKQGKKGFNLTAPINYPAKIINYYPAKSVSVKYADISYEHGRTHLMVDDTVLSYMGDKKSDEM